MGNYWHSDLFPRYIIVCYIIVRKKFDKVRRCKRRVAWKEESYSRFVENLGKLEKYMKERRGVADCEIVFNGRVCNDAKKINEGGKRSQEAEEGI